MINGLLLASLEFLHFHRYLISSTHAYEVTAHPRCVRFHFILAPDLEVVFNDVIVLFVAVEPQLQTFLLFIHLLLVLLKVDVVLFLHLLYLLGLLEHLGTPFGGRGFSKNLVYLIACLSIDFGTRGLSVRLLRFDYSVQRALTLQLVNEVVYFLFLLKFRAFQNFVQLLSR